MGAVVLDQNIVSFFLVFIAIVVGIQAYLQLRIRNILQALTMSADTVVHNVRKMASIGTIGKKHYSETEQIFEEKTSNSCQFCKHRLAYINIEKGSNFQEDFVHRCALRDVNVTLDESCSSFEKDEAIF